MKILIFAPYAIASGHHEVDLEVALRHLNQGDDVHILQCHRELKACDVNPDHALLTCLLCSSRSDESFKRIGIPKSHRHSLDLKKNPLPSPPHFDDIEELKRFQWNDLPAGRATACAAIARMRDTKPDMEAYGLFIRRNLQMYAAVYERVRLQLLTLKPDLFYLFNGRATIMNAAFEAARSTGTKTRVYDRDNFKEFFYCEDTISCDLAYLKRSIQSFKSKMANDPQGEKVANAWFVKNRAGNDEILGATDYLTDQVKGKLPDGFDDKKRNIVIFISSEDEVASTPGFENVLFRTQNEAIRYILAQIPDPTFHFFLRVHPNLRHLDNAQSRELKTLSAPNLTVIPARDAVDTYAIMQACEKVLTFGSTTGIEATYWNCPSVLAGRALYEELDACYVPKSPGELIDLLKATLVPKGRERALAYGYWLQSHGEKLIYIQPQDAKLGGISRFEGRDLMPSRFVQRLAGIVRRFQRLKMQLLGN